MNTLMESDSSRCFFCYRWQNTNLFIFLFFFSPFHISVSLQSAVCSRQRLQSDISDIFICHQACSLTRLRGRLLTRSVCPVELVCVCVCVFEKVIRLSTGFYFLSSFIKLISGYFESNYFTASAYEVWGYIQKNIFYIYIIPVVWY